MAWFDRNAGAKKSAEKQPEKNRQPEVQPTSEPTQPAAAVPASQPKPEPPPKSLDSGLVAYLYKGSRVTGQLSFQGSAKIDGSVDGEIRCNGTLTIGEGAEVKAKISGDSVVIRGKVDGNVAAKEKVELIAPARLYGNVNTPRLIISEGVLFDGDCSMGVARDKAVVASAQSTDKAAGGHKAKLQAESEK